MIDYLQAQAQLRPFYAHPVSAQGLRDAVRARQAFPTDRSLLVRVLKEQYGEVTGPVAENIERLSRPTTFTVTTAHQPNIFTGPLYFTYKILHTVRLAAYAKSLMPDLDFVPVYFMGSEDADLEELGKIHAGGEKLVWDTRQTGAVGRMSPKGLEKILHRLDGEFGGLPHGRDMLGLCRRAYLESGTIQEATLRLVHECFGSYGLVVLIPDNALLKGSFRPVFRKELLEGFSHEAVSRTIPLLEANYKVQAAGREINLFYLLADKRNRIVRSGDGFGVLDSNLHFSRAGILEELETHPERFSPNVILRGVFQETVLPNVSFVGGGGELAYWLELKAVFEAAEVPYPQLVLRNSFTLVPQREASRAASLGIPLTSWFASGQALADAFVRARVATSQVLPEEVPKLQAIYKRIARDAEDIDVTLIPHIEALAAKAMKGLEELEKKFFRARKARFASQLRHIHAVKSALFPGGALQERVENLMPFYAAWGKDLLDAVYAHSGAFEQQFCLLTLPG